MDPYYRFRPFPRPLVKICWNAIWGWSTFARLAADPADAERLADLRRRHATRLLADGIGHSVLDPWPERVPYYCYLGFTLGDFGVLPLEGRAGLRWYPVYDVRSKWERNRQRSAALLARTLSRLQRRYGLALQVPPQMPLP
jgi:hypothetical protein